MLRTKLIALGGLATICFAAYRLLLTEEARQTLRGSLSSVRNDLADIAGGFAMGESSAETAARAEQNREKLRAQWAELGI